MTRTALSLILACALLGALYYVWTTQVFVNVRDDRELEQKKLELEAKLNAKGRVVFAIRDLPEGAEITADSLEVREIFQSRIPQGALGETATAVGHKSRYGISAGQIVSRHDLVPYPE